MTCLSAILAQHGWQITLNASDVIGICGSVATLLSFLFGIYQFYDAKRARLDAKTARALLLRQSVVQHFTASTSKALDLFRAIRQMDWDKCSEVALLLSADVANAAGFPEKIVGTENRTKIDIAVQSMGALMQQLPTSAEQLATEVVQQLTQNCQTVLIAVNAVEGSLRLKTALGGEEEDEQFTSREDNTSVVAENQSGR